MKVVYSLNIINTKEDYYLSGRIRITELKNIPLIKYNTAQAQGEGKN